MKNSQNELDDPSRALDSDELLRLERQAEKSVKNILFVCTGNICRSPVAEYLLRRELEKQKIDSITTSSAGLMDIGQQPASGEMTEIAGDFGVDMRTHHSKILTEGMVADADLVFVMEVYHKNKIGELFLDQGHKVFTLGLFDCKFNGVDITDPLGRGLYSYRYCFDRIYSAVQKLIPIISRKVL